MNDVSQLLIRVAFLLVAALAGGRGAGGDEYLLDTWQAPEGLPHNEVIALAQSRDGFLWLATPHGLARFDGFVFKQFSREHIPELIHGRIVSLRIDRDDRIWAGLEDGALLRGRPGRFEAVTLDQTRSPAGIHGVYADRQGRIVVSDREGRIFQGGRDTLMPWLDARGAGPGPFVGINMDLDGGVWVRHGNTLSWWAKDHWELLRAPDTQAEFFALKTGAAQGGGMWIGGRDGLQRFENGRWLEGKRLFPQPLASIQLIMEDSRRQVWVTTGAGHVWRFDAAGALQPVEWGQRFAATPIRHLLEDDEGNLWAAAQGAGLIRLRPSNSGGNSGREATIPGTPPVPRFPRIVLDQVWADAQLLRRAPWPAVGTRPPPVLQVPVGTEVVTIRYAVVSLSEVRPPRRQCRLDGVDRDWIDAGLEGMASYTNLPPRDYVFRVRAASESMDWSERQETLAFVVAAPFWQSWPFRVGTGAAILVALVWGYHARVSALERQRSVQRSFSQRLIESQEAERQRIAADLHDSLGQKLLVIKNDAQFGLLTRHTADALSEQLRRVSDTASECLEEIRHIALNLRPYQLDQMGLTRAIRSLVGQMERAGLKWERVEMDDVDGLIRPALEINLYRVVQEACSNILRHAAASGATLRMERCGPELHLAIGDNGRGFDPRAAETPGAPPGGFGLTGMRERVAILGGQLEVRSVPGQGTTLFIQLPIQSDIHEPDHSDRG
ncbi:MAG: histidine kinase [Verrucomicrobiota bacterium]